MNVSLYKYQTKNPFFRRLVRNYFFSVQSLCQRIGKEVASAAEVGCGEGYSTKEILSFLDPSVSFKAFEPSASSIELALQLNPELDIYQQEICEIDPSAHQSDLVMMLQVLEHLENSEQALRKLAELSTKYLIIGVPNEPIWRICNLLRLSYLTQLGNTPGHLSHWNPDSITALVEANYGPVLELQTPLPWIVLLAKKSVAAD